MRYFLSKAHAAAVVSIVALPLQESAAETRVEGIVLVRELREQVQNLIDGMAAR